MKQKIYKNEILIKLQNKKRIRINPDTENFSFIFSRLQIKSLVTLEMNILYARDNKKRQKSLKFAFNRSIIFMCVQSLFDLFVFVILMPFLSSGKFLDFIIFYLLSPS